MWVGRFFQQVDKLVEFPAAAGLDLLNADSNVFCRNLLPGLFDHLRGNRTADAAPEDLHARARFLYFLGCLPVGFIHAHGPLRSLSRQFASQVTAWSVSRADLFFQSMREYNR